MKKVAALAVLGLVLLASGCVSTGQAPNSGTPVPSCTYCFNSKEAMAYTVLTNADWMGDIPLYGSKSVNYQDCVDRYSQASNQRGTFPDNAFCVLGSVNTQNSLASLPSGNVGYATCFCWKASNIPN